MIELPPRPLPPVLNKDGVNNFYTRQLHIANARTVKCIATLSIYIEQEISIVLNVSLYSLVKVLKL